MRKYQVAIILLVLCVTGCIARSVKQNTEPETLPAGTDTNDEVSSFEDTETDTPTANPSPQVTALPELPLTATATVAPDNSSTPTAVPTVQVFQQCTESEPELVEESSLLQGLILVGKWEEGVGIAILGSDGMRIPATVYFYTEQLLEGVSPDGKWIATSSLTDIIDESSNRYTVEVNVTDFDAERSFQKIYEEVSLSSFDNLRWANNSQLVLPLKNQGDLFQWLVWKPLTGEEEILSVELMGIENAMSFYQVSPSYDPNLELVIYPCELCGSTAYIVKNLKTGQTEWTLNFDPEPSYAYRGTPVWSPNAEYVVVGGGITGALNRLKIVNRDGTTLYDIGLPDAGVAAAERLVWSPNSEYLAFSRANPNPNEPFGYNSTLAYVRLSDGAVIDVCVDLPITTIEWSPDNTKIAFSQRNEEDESLNVISIVDINTGDIFQLYDPGNHSIVGWTQHLEDGGNGR